MKTRLLTDRQCDRYGAAFAAAVFLFDIYQPMGIAGAMPYIALPLLGLLARSYRSTLNLAILGTFLNIAGILLATSGAPLYVVVVNHVMSGVLVWMVAYVALNHMAVGDELRSTLHDAAFRDPLTKLYNRRYLSNVIGNGLEQYHRYAYPMSLIMIDADHFKRINDRYGHAAGDAALMAVAQACNKSVRMSDVVGRFGGEEFLIFLPNTRAEEAAIVAERIRNSMRDKDVTFDGHTFGLTLSLGVAEAGEHTQSLDDLIRASDQAMYAAKNSGRNQTAIARSQGPGKDITPVPVRAA